MTAAMTLYGQYQWSTTQMPQLHSWGMPFKGNSMSQTYTNSYTPTYADLPFYPPTHSPIPWIYDTIPLSPPYPPMSLMSPFDNITPTPNSMSPQPPTPNKQEILIPQEIAAVMKEMRETRTEPVWLGGCHIIVLKEQYDKKSYSTAHQK